MDRMIYLSMSGAKSTMERQEVLANNLANSSTTGFRAQLHAYRSVPVQGDGASTRVYSLETTPGYDPTPGPTSATGRSLDVAMRGNSWLSLQGLDGTEAYTRAGSLMVSNDGTLVNPNGLPVIGEGGPLQVPPTSEVNIGKDGTVSATTVGAPPQVIGKLKMVTPEAPLLRGTDGLFRTPGGEALNTDPAALLESGALEGSNVSPIGELVAMIQSSRNFESHMKLLQTAESDEKTAAQLLSMG